MSRAGGANVAERVAECQERRLREAAFASRDFAGLIHFYAVRKEAAALQCLAAEVGDFAPADRLSLDLLLGEEPRILLERLSSDTDPWSYYSLTKALLRQGCVGEATRLMERSLYSGEVRDFSVVNLLAKYLWTTSQKEMAKELAGLSLGMNARQADMLAIRDASPDGQAESHGLYLDLWPKHLPVSFYLPVYKVEEHIRGAIEALLDMAYPIEEILLVDDASPDASIEMARGYPVRVVAHEENRGLAAARNTAFQHLRTAYVGTVDTDARPSPDYMKFVAMEWENALPEVAGVGGRLHEAYSESPADLFRSLHMSQDLGGVRIHPPDYLFGANTVFRRDAVLDVGGYDEAYRTNAEDYDLGRRLRAAGYSFVFTPLAQATHMRRDTPASVLRSLWNWSYMTKCGLNVFETWSQVASRMPEIVAETERLLRNDFAAGHHGALYVDFLFLFNDAFRDLDEARERGLVEAPEVSWLKGRFLDALEAGMGDQYAALAAHIVSDTQPLVGEREREAGQASPRAASAWQSTEPALGRFFEGLATDLCQSIEASAGACQ